MPENISNYVTDVYLKRKKAIQAVIQHKEDQILFEKTQTFDAEAFKTSLKNVLMTHIDDLAKSEKSLSGHSVKKFLYGTTLFSRLASERKKEIAPNDRFIEEKQQAAQFFITKSIFNTGKDTELAKSNLFGACLDELAKVYDYTGAVKFRRWLQKTCANNNNDERLPKKLKECLSQVSLLLDPIAQNNRKAIQEAKLADKAIQVLGIEFDLAIATINKLIEETFAKANSSILKLKKQYEVYNKLKDQLDDAEKRYYSHFSSDKSDEEKQQNLISKIIETERWIDNGGDTDEKVTDTEIVYTEEGKRILKELDIARIELYLLEDEFFLPTNTLAGLKKPKDKPNYIGDENFVNMVILEKIDNASYQQLLKKIAKTYNDTLDFPGEFSRFSVESFTLTSNSNLSATS